MALDAQAGSGRPGRPPALDFMKLNPTRRNQAALLGAHMLIDNVPWASIRFLINVYEIFLDVKQTTAKALADLYKCSPQAAGKHVKCLQEFGYLTRIHYRAWKVNDEYLAFLGQAA